MDVKEYLKEVAYIDKVDISPDESSEIYCSKFDNSYITHVGLENDVKFLADREITENLTHGVGFSPRNNKWYGWSHRAICGFTIGSTCKRGDCHYRALDVESKIEEYKNFYTNLEITNYVIAKRISYNKIRVFFGDRNKGDTITSVDHYFYPENMGKGEWVAETMEDAYQMACDFSEGVS